MDTCNNPDKAANAGPTNTGGACAAGPDYSATGGARCYNRSSLANVRHPFGILYLFLENGIPVSVILNDQKAGLADEDFHVSATSGSSTSTVTLIQQSSSGVYAAVAAATGINCGTNTVYYGGMPFVIDSSFTQQAIAVLQNFNAAHSNEFADVPLHIANYAFSAPVLGAMESRPKPVLIDGSPLDTFFDESGIPDVVAGGTTFLMMNGTYSYSWPSSLGSNGVCTNACTTVYNGTKNFIDVIWSTNQNVGILNSWSAIPNFFKQGGTVLALDSAQAWESVTGGNLGGGIERSSHGDESSPFCASAVVANPASPLTNKGTAPEYPASNRFFQIGDIDFTVHGNGGGADGASAWDYTSVPTASGTEGLGNGDGYSALAGHPMVSGSQTAGNLVYLASLNSWHGGSANKDGGLHIMYDSLVTGNNCGVPSTNVPSELTRSTAVATYSATSAKVAEYLGTFDWFLPSNLTAMGNVLYAPDPTVYPYMTGHFREYKQAGTFTNNAGTDYKVCNSTNALSACNWDAATKLKPFASRNVYVVTGSAGSWSMTAASSLGSDATIGYISGKLDKDATTGVLGGVDFGAPAIIEGLPSGLVSIGNAKSRPTIAYVGARDGMLHAFCVAGAGGTGTCYGKNPGEEIWALIPPGMKTQMDKAYNSGTNMNWAKVNVGGILRVADVQDTFEGASGYRTVMLIGAHDSGYIDALDISDPDPANLNQPGFSFLWEQDGSTIAGGTTQEPMGKTWGASFALTGSSDGGAVAVVSGSTCRGEGFGTTACPSTIQNGMNFYVLRMRDGLVVNTDKKTYTRNSVLFGTPVPNDVPATPTTLDADDDGFDETVLVPSLEGYVYKYVLKTGTAPTLASLDTSKSITIFDASASCTPSGQACEPIGAPVSIVRNLRGSEFGAVVATGGADWARGPSSTQAFHIYEFDPEKTALTTAYASQVFPGMTPPVSGAPGAGSGTTGTPLALRGFAQPTISGSDVYAEVTTISIGTLSQVVQPLITPGTYGTVLRYANANDGTTLPVGAYAVAQGTTFAGGAGATFTFTSSTGNEDLFAADVTGASRQTMQSAPSSSTPSAAFAINQSAGSSGRNFTVQTWIDGN